MGWYFRKWVRAPLGAKSRCTFGAGLPAESVRVPTIFGNGIVLDFGIVSVSGSEEGVEEWSSAARPSISV